MKPDLVGMDGRVTAVRSIIRIIESTEEGKSGVVDRMPEHTEQFFLQRVLVDTVEMMQRCLGSPTDVKGGGDMRPCPVENPGDLMPIGHLTERQHLHGCPGDDHSVVVAIFDVGKCGVKRHQMFNRRMG